MTIPNKPSEARGELHPTDEAAQLRAREVDAARREAELARWENELARRETEAELARKEADAEAARRQAEADLARRQTEVELARREAEIELARREAEIELLRRQAEVEAARREADSELTRRRAEAESAHVGASTGRLRSERQYSSAARSAGYADDPVSAFNDIANRTADELSRLVGAVATAYVTGVRSTVEIVNSTTNPVLRRTRPGDEPSTTRLGSSARRPSAEISAAVGRLLEMPGRLIDAFYESYKRRA